MRKCVFAGTFDPFTVGHEDTVRKCLALFDEVVVAVAENKQKRSFFSAQEREEMIAAVYRDEPRVHIVRWDGIIVDLLKKEETPFYVRGLRNTVDFDYEITLLTVRHCAGTAFLKPIGHHQVDGDYRESWQPQDMSPAAIAKAEHIAKEITDALGGYGIFGVELFVKGEDVIFSEVSPRPHDTGMVTMISQDLSEFALHARAVLGLPVPEVKFYGPSASKAIVVEGDTREYEFCNLEKVLEEPGVNMRIFGKPEIRGHRRLGVLLATAPTVEEALAKVERAYAKLTVKVY